MCCSNPSAVMAAPAVSIASLEAVAAALVPGCLPASHGSYRDDEGCFAADFTENKNGASRKKPKSADVQRSFVVAEEPFSATPFFSP